MGRKGTPPWPRDNMYHFCSDCIDETHDPMALPRHEKKTESPAQRPFLVTGEHGFGGWFASLPKLPSPSSRPAPRHCTLAHLLVHVVWIYSGGRFVFTSPGVRQFNEPSSGIRKSLVLEAYSVYLLSGLAVLSSQPCPRG